MTKEEIKNQLSPIEWDAVLIAINLFAQHRVVFPDGILSVKRTPEFLDYLCDFIEFMKQQQNHKTMLGPLEIEILNPDKNRNFSGEVGLIVRVILDSNYPSQNSKAHIRSVIQKLEFVIDFSRERNDYAVMNAIQGYINYLTEE